MISNQGVSVTSTQIPVTLGQAVVPTITDQSSLTTQATQSVMSEARYTSAQEALEPIQNPYPSQTPTALLTRQYKVAEFDFTPGFTTGEVHFPEVLFSQTVIQAAMVSFPYWRSDVKVHIKMQAVPQQRGALMASWLPCTNLATASKIVASGNHATILNVSTSDTATFVIPYLSPKAWLKYPNVTPSDHSTLYLNTLVPLGSPTGVSAVVKISVYASFDNPKVAGFVHSDVAQSMQPLQKIVSTVSPLIKTLSDLATTVEPALKVLNLLDKPETPLSKTMFIAEHGMQAPYWLTEAEQPAISMSLKERPYLSNTVNLFPLGKSSDSFAALAANPMMCFQKEVVAAGDRIEYPVNPCVPAFDGVNFAPDYLFHFTRYAQFWRGGLRFFMHFCCDQFTSARFRVGLSYKPWNSVWAESGDIPSVVVDVHGSTYYGLTVPYLHDEYWQRVVIPFTAGSVYQPKLIIEALDAPVGSTAPIDPKIVITLFRAAAPDFQLAEPGYNIPDDAQCSLEAAFSKGFASIIPDSLLTMETGMCMPETLDSPSQICKRVCETIPAAGTITGDSPSTIPHWYLNLTAQVFAFWRGSRRVHLESSLITHSVTTGVSVPNPISPVLQTNTGSLSQTVVLPYYSPLPYRVDPSYTYTGAPFASSVTWFSTTGTITRRYRFSAGDDLVCGHLIAPRYVVSPPS